jgi:hypothetical protein
MRDVYVKMAIEGDLRLESKFILGGTAVMLENIYR